ncbi:MAG: hypothetical protein AAFP81_18545 [Pseudomonadota bacterium]
MAAAFDMADALNERLQDWRDNVQIGLVKGSVGWLLETFLKHDDVIGLSNSSQDEYARCSKYLNNLKNKKTKRYFQDKDLTGISVKEAAGVYRSLAKKHGQYMANKALGTIQYAWDLIHIQEELYVPESNPFRKIKKRHTDAEETYNASYEQLESFISAAIAMNEIAMAFAARLAWDFHVRISEIFADCSFDHWRPDDRPHDLWVTSSKTSRGKVKKTSAWIPLDDQMTLEDGEVEWVCLFPELEDLYRMLPYEGGLLCQRERRTGKRIHQGEWVPIKNSDKIARRICKKAKLPIEVTMETFRHGGLTELGDAGASDRLIMARSRHKKAETVSRYVHRTNTQATKAQKLRLAHRQDKA